MANRESVIKRPRVVLAGLFIVGVAAILVGWLLVPDDQFLESVLLEIGAGILLFAALLLVERDLVASFEKSIDAAQQESRRAVEEVTERVGQVEESVADVRSEVTRLGELGDEMKEALAERDAEIEQAFEDFAEGVSPATITRVLREAERLDAIDQDGVRVHLEGTALRLRFKRIGVPSSQSQLGPPVVRLAIEEFDGTQIHRIHWLQQSHRDVILEVVERLRARGDYNEAFDPDEIFERFRDSVRTAVELKTRARSGPSDLSPVVEIPNDQWAVTTYGVECLESRYFIEKDRFDEDWLSHMREKNWVDLDKFREAYDIAKAIRDREERERIEAEAAPF